MRWHENILKKWVSPGQEIAGGVTCIGMSLWFSSLKIATQRVVFKRSIATWHRETCVAIGTCPHVRLSCAIMRKDRQVVQLSNTYGAGGLKPPGPPKDFTMWMAQKVVEASKVGAD
jgi:hypothetical protein